MSNVQVDTLITGISQLVSPLGAGAKHGPAMSELHRIDNAAIAIADGRFAWIGQASDWHGEAANTVDLGGRAVVPGLIDPHTHAVWAGNRLADFDLRTSGATYEQILASGGGIRSTIRATQNTSLDDLVALALPRLRALMASGATVIEVKSGYGFTPAAELKMLQAIHILQSRVAAKLSPTLLIHLPPSENSTTTQSSKALSSKLLSTRSFYIEQITSELIPEVARQRLAMAVDIFVEKEAWQANEAEQVLTCALEHGLAIKLHTEQFHAIGGLELGVKLGALSVDHLEACNSTQYAELAASNTIGTLLPSVSLHLGIPCAPGRALIDSGAAIAVGTDLNPGSSPLFSMSQALALAVRLNGLTATEALIAGTVNAAAALGMHDAGRIESGLSADFCVLRSSDWRDLVYTLGANAVREVWIAGKKTDGTVQL